MSIKESIINYINMSNDDIIKFVFMCQGFGYHWDKNIDKESNFLKHDNYLEIVIDHDYTINEYFNYENVVICFNNRKTEYEIRNMKNYIESQINKEYYSTILIFKLNSINILQDVKDYMINHLNNEIKLIKERTCTCNNDKVLNLCRFNKYGTCEEMIKDNENIIIKL